jgi:hypothetical protein
VFQEEDVGNAEHLRDDAWAAVLVTGDPALEAA